MNDTCDTKINEDYSRVVVDKVSYEKLIYRLTMCRGCEHWQETGKTYRCFGCRCHSNFIFLDKSRCPIKSPHW